MKSLFKKTAISMFVMGMAGSSFAMHQTNSNAMWSPHFTGWFIGVDGLDLRPMNGDLDFVTLSSGSGNSHYFETTAISTGYQWNWRLYAGIKFTDNDDITLSWLSMRDSNSSSVNIPVNNESLTVTPIFIDDTGWNTISGRVNFKLDDVYGVWGHTIHFNNPWSVRYAAGIEYARLNSNESLYGEIFGTTAIDFTAHSHLKGVGPRVEFDMTYHLPCNLALFADANAALLVAKREVSLSGQIDTFGESTTTEAFFDSEYSTRHIVVPKFGSRLGASYTAVWGSAGGEGACGSAVVIDAGWQVDSYVHAIERPTILDTKVSNFSDQGFFVGLKFESGWL